MATLRKSIVGLVVGREFSKSVIQKLVDAGFVAYWAGGCVRDLLRGLDAHDYDVATNASPDQVRKLFGPRQTYAVGESFGVIIVLGPKASKTSVEVATFRQESDYTDGRRPDRVEYTTAENDAQRRDFTINGMFYDPLNQTLHDYVGGQADLKAEIIRAIGVPQERMMEDKLRMLRAVRFAARFRFEIESETVLAIKQLADQMQIVSIERIAQELRKMLVEPTRATAMSLTAEMGLMQTVLPEAIPASEIAHASPFKSAIWQQNLRILEELKTDRFETAVAVLLRDAPQQPNGQRQALADFGTVLGACQRLKISNDERDAIVWLTSHREKLLDLAHQPICEFKKLAAHELFLELLEIRRATVSVTGEPDESIPFLTRKLAEIPPEERNPPPLITGAELLAAGHRAGPKFKRLLEAVRDAQLNGELHNLDQALELVEKLSQNPDC